MSEVSFERRGSGPPLVLVHGLGSRWQCYEPVIAQIAERHEVIGVDLPGFGATPLDDRYPVGAAGYARWLADWLELEGVADPHVVGNSMGGGVALEMGRNGVASRVTAFSPIGFWHTPGRVWTQSALTALRVVGRVAAPVLPQLAALRPVKAVLGGVIARPSQLSAEDAIGHVQGLIACPGFPAARATFAAYTFTERSDPGRLRDVPVTIAWGTRDYILTHRTQSARARALMPFAHHVDLPGLGHVPFSDDPELCARVILEETP